MQPPFKHPARFIGAGLLIGRIGDLAQLGLLHIISAVHRCGSLNPDFRAHGFREPDNCFARTRLREPHNRLPGGHHLARLPERLDNGSICIGNKNRIFCFVFRDICVSLSGGQLCRRRIQQGFRSFILLRRGGRGLHQHGKAFLIGFRLDKCRLCCDDSVSLGGQSKAKVSLVKPHQWLSSAYLLPDVDKTFNDLARNAKAEIALDPNQRFR